MYENIKSYIYLFLANFVKEILYPEKGQNKYVTYLFLVS